MDLPDSRIKNNKTALRQYLENISAPYADSNYAPISWYYPSDVHSPHMNPQGQISISRYYDKNSKSNTNSGEYNLLIRLRLLVSNSNEYVLDNLLSDWMGFLSNDLIYNLRVKGTEYQGKNLLKNIRLTEAQTLLRINQDSGGTGAVLIVCNLSEFIHNRFNI